MQFVFVPVMQCALTQTRSCFLIGLEPYFSSNQRSKRQPENPVESQAKFDSRLLSGVALFSTSTRSIWNTSRASNTFSTLLWQGSLLMYPLACASRRSVMKRRADIVE